MQSQNFNNDDGLYDLVNIEDDFVDEEINTSRTEDLIFNSNPIDWDKKFYINKQCHLNENNSSVTVSKEEHTSSAFEKKGTFNLHGDLTPRSQFFNDKALQNIDKFLPRSFKSKLQLSADFNQSNFVSYILCSECNMKTASDLDWCLSCGSFLINQKKPISFNSSQEQPATGTENNSTIDTNHRLVPKENEIRLIKFETCQDFDRIYKKSSDYFDNHASTHNDIGVMTDIGGIVLENGGIMVDSNGIIIENDTKSPCYREEVKLNLSELQASLMENRAHLSKFDLDIDIIDCETKNRVGDNRVSPKLPTIPPLDLSDLQSTREKPDTKPIVKHKQDSKENENKPNRKWVSSSMAWDEMPENLLKKKPGKYYRSKLNSCTNKIGLNVFPSKVEQGRPSLARTAGRSLDERGSPVWWDRNGVDGNHGKKAAFHESCDYTKNVEDVNEEEQNLISIDQSNKNNCNIVDVITPLPSTNIGIDNSWQCLPAEIWIKIMLFLPHASLSRLQQTCRRIYSIGLDSQFWRCVTLFRNNNLTDGHIVNIANKMPKELHFKNCCGTSITFNGLKEMFNICGRNVERLSFISCSKGALEGDQFLVLSAAFCPNVTHINASYLMNLQDSTLISMTEGFNKIVSLNLMGAHSISNESIRSLIKNHRSSLTSLDLYGCFKLNSGTLRILEECLNLKSLALGSINKLKRVAMVDLLKKLSRLTNLDLRGTMNLIDDSLLAQICVLCPCLQQIILTNSCLVGNQGLKSLANSNVSKTLKVLDICGCLKINDNGVEALLKNCQNLEDLDISCTGITGRITRLFTIYPPPNLKCLRVNNNKSISESELASIVKSSKKLNTVYMCGITSIDTWRSLETKYKHIFFKHE